jgi:hypothetical protein
MRTAKNSAPMRDRGLRVCGGDERSQHKNGVTEFAADGSLLVTDRGIRILQSAFEIEEKKHLAGVQQVFQKIIRPF